MKLPELTFEPFFTWINRPRIMYAPGVRKEIGFELEQLGGSRVAVYSDKGVVQAGVAQQIIEEIEKSGLSFVGLFDDIQQDARLDNINHGARFYREHEADCMVAVGGGSVLDTAKAINILIGHGGEDFQPFADQAGLWEGALRLPPHVAFPTTAGTGCEVTNALVVLDTAAQAKLSVTHPYCNADLAMLDPELTVGLPARITAFTGMDALTHAIEGVTSTGAQPISDALGLHAVRLIFKYLPRAVKDPTDIDARGNMLIAASLAGMCFCNTMTGACHATAHALGALYGIPHGLANAIMLPHVMQFNREACPERYMVVAEASGINVQGMEPEDAAAAAVNSVVQLKNEIGLCETLKDHGVPEDAAQLAPLVELAAADGQISYNPRYAEESDVLELFVQARGNK
jgi:alcohol dehydrogenase